MYKKHKTPAPYQQVFFSRSCTNFYICNFVFFFLKEDPPNCIHFMPQTYIHLCPYLTFWMPWPNLSVQGIKWKTPICIWQNAMCMCVSVTKPSHLRKGENPIVTNPYFIEGEWLRNCLCCETPSVSLYQKISYFKDLQIN